MAYNSAIPTANQRLKDSQPLILANFQALASFGNGYVTFINQVSAPAVSGTDLVMYNKTSSLTSQSELFFNRNGGTAYEFTAALQDANGWTRLPSGILLKWGTQGFSSAVIGTTQTITFPTGATIPAFTSIYQSNISMQASSTGDTNTVAYTGALATASFEVRLVKRDSALSATNITIKYFAIGV